MRVVRGGRSGCLGIEGWVVAVCEIYWAGLEGDAFCVCRWVKFNKEDDILVHRIECFGDLTKMKRYAQTSP